MYIQYNLTAEDVAALGRHTARTSAYARRGFYGCAIFVPIAIICLFVTILPQLWLWSLVLSIVWICLLSYWRHRLAHVEPSSFQNIARQKGVVGRHNVAITAEGLRETTDVNNTLYTWGAIKAIERTDQHLFFYLNHVLAHTIPLSEFEDRPTADAFYHTAQAYFYQKRGHVYQQK